MIVDPVPRQARDELERLGVRWQQLPLARALPHVPALRALAQRLADVGADAMAAPRVGLPDLGPATAFDQLVVAAYDVAAAAERGGSTSPRHDLSPAQDLETTGRETPASSPPHAGAAVAPERSVAVTAAQSIDLAAELASLRAALAAA